MGCGTSSTASTAIDRLAAKVELQAAHITSQRRQLVRIEADLQRASALAAAAAAAEGRLAEKFAWETIDAEETADRYQKAIGVRGEKVLRAVESAAADARRAVKSAAADARRASKLATAAAAAARGASAPSLSEDEWGRIVEYLADTGDANLGTLLEVSRSSREGAVMHITECARRDVERGILGLSATRTVRHTRVYLDAWIHHVVSMGETIDADGMCRGKLATIDVFQGRIRHPAYHGFEYLHLPYVLSDESPHQAAWHHLVRAMVHSGGGQGMLLGKAMVAAGGVL